MSRKTLYFVIVALLGTMAWAAPITVDNFSFELPGNGKIVGWDMAEGAHYTSAGAPPAEVPGWEADGIIVDSGVEPGSLATEGTYFAFLMGSDSSVYQTTGYTIGTNDSFTLTVDAQSGFALCVLRMTLYYLNGSTRVAFATTDVATPVLPRTPTPLGPVTFTALAAPESAGKQLGIELDNTGVGSSWLNFDNVRLVSNPVSPIYPNNGAPVVPIDQATKKLTKDLQWIVKNGYEIDLYFGLENDPNLGTKPAYKRISRQVAGTWETIALDYLTTYYWRVDAYEPNSLGGYTLVKGPVWSFTTVPASPVITTQPVSLTVSAGSPAVFTVEQVNGTTLEWYKQGITNPVATGTLVLTINDVEQPNEGFYYFKATNAAGSATSDKAQLLTKRLIAHWDFENNSLVSTVGGWTGAISNPDFVAGGGIAGDAYQFYGDGRLIEILDSADYFNFYPRGFTVSAWIKTIKTDWAGIVSKHDRPDTDTGWILQTRPSGAGVATVRDGGADVSGTTNVIDNNWHLLVGQYDLDARRTRIFVDGKLEAEGAVGTAAPAVTPSPVRIGNDRRITASPNYPMVGLVDEVRIWSYVLDPYEIAHLYVDLKPGEKVCTVNPVFDITGPDDKPDCRVDMYDMAAFAGTWLECNIVPDCR